eukprot:3493614-Pyramimonas_sp.AAC.1
MSTTALAEHDIMQLQSGGGVAIIRGSADVGNDAKLPFATAVRTAATTRLGTNCRTTICHCAGARLWPRAGTRHRGRSGG